MATVAEVITQLESLYGHTHVVTWSPLTGANAVGAAVAMSGGADRSIHVFGTYGGATVTIEVSNEGASPANFVAAHDPQGNTLTFATPAKIESVSEASAWIRPNSAGGDGTQSLTVAMLVRRTV